MIKSLEKTGRTEEEAIAAALQELGLERDDVSVTVTRSRRSRPRLWPQTMSMRR